MKAGDVTPGQFPCGGARLEWNSGQSPIAAPMKPIFWSLQHGEPKGPGRQEKARFGVFPRFAAAPETLSEVSALP